MNQRSYTTSPIANIKKAIYSTSSFLFLKTKHTRLRPIFAILLLSSILIQVALPIVVSAAPSPDTSTAACTAAGGTWSSDNSGGWCSKSPGDLGPAQRAQNWAVTNAFIWCVKESDGKLIDDNPGLTARVRISEANLKSGIWFKNNAAYDFWGEAIPHNVAGSFVVDSVSDRGQTKCNNILKAVANLTGYGTDYKKLWCDVVRVNGTGIKADGTSCESNGGSDYSGDSKNRGRLKDFSGEFQTMIKNKAFRGGGAPLGNDALYVLYYEAFTNNYGCYTTPVSSPGSNSNKVYKAINYADGSGKLTKSDFEGAASGDKRWVYTDDSYNQKEYNCRYIADRVNEYAPAYADWVLDHGPENTNEVKGDTSQVGGGGNAEEKSCEIGALGWIICPVMEFMGGITDAAYKIVSDLLVTPPLSTTLDATKNPTYAAWTIMRNIANVAFIIAILLIIYSQLTSVGLSNYGIKKLLPRIIVAAILVNLSYWICALAVDASNIAGGTLKNVIDSIATGYQPVNGGGIIDKLSDGSNMWTNAVGFSLVAGAAAGTMFLYPAIVLPLLIAALAAIVTVLIVLTIRQALIILLIVIAPLAFVAYLLPNTEGLFKKWLGLLKILLLMFPIIAVIFGVSAFAGKVVMSSANGNILVQIMGAGVTMIPLFITPIIMKAAGGVLNRVAGVVNNPNKGAFDRMRNKTKDIQNNSAYKRGQVARKSIRTGRKNSKFADQYELGRQIATAGEDDPNRYINNGGGAIETAKRAAAVRAYNAARGPASIADATANAATRAAQNSSSPTLQYLGGVASAAHAATGVSTRTGDLSELSEHYKSQVEKATEEGLRDGMRSLAKELAVVKANNGNQDDFLVSRARDTSQTETARNAAIHELARQGRDDAIRKLGDNTDSKNANISQAVVQQAIGSNVGSLIGKAPDLVKTAGPAFNNANGKDLASFSAGTIAKQMEHLAKLKNDGDPNYAGALASFQSAIQDIQRSPDLQATFKVDAGNAIIAAKGTTIGADISREITMLESNGGKIREIPPSTP